MALTQIRGSQIRSGTILDAQISASAAIATSKLADGASFLKRDGTVALTADLNANSNKIINLAAPVSNGDAVNLSHLNTQLALYLKKDGTVAMTGNLDLGNNKVVSLATPTASGDAANKGYVDGLDANNLKRNGTVALTGNLDANSNKIINLSDPTATQDAATKAYVDSVAQGLQVKQSVRVATTANIALNGTQTIDGVAVVAGNRVLVKNQSTGSANGIYVVAAGAWSRSADLDAVGELVAGIFTFVEEGTVNADSGWVLVSNNPLVLGTDALTFAQFSGAGSITAGAGLTKTGNTLDIASANGAIVVNADNVALTLANASLAITGSGLKIADGTAGQVLVANASGIPVAQTLSGAVASVSSSGVVTLASTVPSTSSFVVRETPSGLINGTNTGFTLANTPVVGTEQVFLNGLLLDAAGEDYSISGTAITLISAPQSGDKLRVSYIK